ncbi:dipeptide ABC transporter ATP-binding protein [Mycetocola tolaasinivorans]|uniref:dipeptide ABC transporter ATP-binding protein n=1 Tax=Mycetocola tolaasinivorans TaxID=76635 RepID=UPI001FE8EB2E|nr:ABC transporter ATP-binding protein [Mycetocola tolaasinivorans]
MAGTEPAALLDIRSLRVRFAGSAGYAVDGVSLRVYPGEIVAIVGESGSGKSVTALATLGLLPADAEVSGSIRVGGTEVVDAAPALLNMVRGRVAAMVFQDPVAALDPVATIEHQIGAVLRRHRPTLGAEERRARVIELLELVGIPEATRRARDYPHRFSGGQLQRIVIALALAAEPELLLADEPTTALDVTIQQEILELLRTLNSRLGTAIAIITHDMGVVADLARRVIVLRSGRIVETAPVHRLFTAPAEPYTRELLAAVPDGTDPAPPLPEDGEAPVLEVRDLRVNYRTRFARTPDVVRDISFTISPGETLGMVGESGSGKSSIGRSLLGLAPLTGGTVRIAGRELASVSRAEQRRIRAGIGMVFQSPSGSLNPRQSIGESIAEPLRVARHLREHSGVRGSAAIRAEVATLLEQVRLPAAWSGRYPHELSGGQRQRVGIARALALRPQLLIADEPTSALDVSVQAEILDLLREIQAERRLACLFISHDLFVVQSLCHSVLVLRGGRIIERGPTDRVLREPQDPYTRALVLSAPLPDPDAQALRRERWLEQRASA